MSCWCVTSARITVLRIQPLAFRSIQTAHLRCLVAFMALTSSPALVSPTCAPSSTAPPQDRSWFCQVSDPTGHPGLSIQGCPSIWLPQHNLLAKLDQQTSCGLIHLNEIHSLVKQTCCQFKGIILSLRFGLGSGFGWGRPGVCSISRSPSCRYQTHHQQDGDPPTRGLWLGAEWIFLGSN